MSRRSVVGKEKRSGIIEREGHRASWDKARSMQVQRASQGDIRVASQGSKAGSQYREPNSHDAGNDQYSGEKEDKPHRRTSTRGWVMRRRMTRPAGSMGCTMWGMWWWRCVGYLLRLRGIET